MAASHLSRSRLARLPLLAAAMAALLVALGAGLRRLGWSWPWLDPAQPLNHGALMVSGFLGTLIALERAVALQKRWAYLGPLLSAMGTLGLVLGDPSRLSPALMVASSLALVAVFAVMLRRHPSLDVAVMALGAAAWLVGNLFWFSGWPVFRIALWWGAFLVLTIAGERLELGRLVRLSRGSRWAFALATAILLIGLAGMLLAFDSGVRLAGAGLLLLAGWLLRYDIARRTIRRPGLPRYAALCLLGGFAWLAVAGGLALAFGGVAAGPRYDALLHALFLGFVFTMIFGHAPIIFPAVLGLEIRFSRWLYLPLVLLHLSLGLRLGGDLLLNVPARLWGGLFNGVAILVFLALTAAGLGRRGQPDRPAPA